MFETSLVKSLKEKVEELRMEVFKLKQELMFQQRESEVKKQEAITALRDAMKKSLIESDLARQEAIAKLEVYEKLDTKADANTIKDMIGKLIEAIGKNKQDINVIK